MKKLLCLSLMMTVLAACAGADGYVEIKPGKDDLTAAEAKRYAVAFYAEKCGLSETALLAADWRVTFGHSTVEKPEDAIWTIAVENIRDHDTGMDHVIYLTGPGGMIEWYGHGQKYTQENPRLLDNAEPVVPHASDIQEAEVTALLRREMTEQGFVRDAAGLTMDAHFVYDANFNGGDIPVWLVQIGDGQGGNWKAAVTHKGTLLSLGTFEQVYQDTRTRGENFLAETFPGDAYIAEYELLNGILESRLTHEERAAVTARWRPLVEAWIADHPYYLNRPGQEYQVTMVNIYGVPDAHSIPEKQAEQLAGAALTAYLGGNAYLDERTVRIDYFVTDPEKPVWAVRFGRPREKGNFRAINRENPAAASLFNVTVDAYTGAVYKIESTETIY